MANLINFFAYGELMNEEQFKANGLEYVDKTSVTLSAWRVLFNKIPKDNGGQEGLGLINIEATPNNDGMMFGVLYEMDEKYLPRLDEVHGHPNEYTRKVFRFTRHDFNLVNGFAYVAHPEKVQKGLKPSKAAKKILKAAKPHMPMLYFSRLMNIRTID